MKQSNVINRFVFLIAFSAFQTVCPGQSQADDKPLTLGDAMNAAIVPHQTVQRYPDYVSVGAKGIVQRSLFDFKNAKKSLQIAFVIDATSTMKKDIDSLRQDLTEFVEGIKQQVGGVSDAENVFVEIALLVYRDMWKTYDFDKNQLVEARTDPVEILSQGKNSVGQFLDFERDFRQIDEILKPLSTGQLERGDPGFPEQVDRGVYAALTEVVWSSDQNVTRIILVAGDAPPWDETYTEYDKNPDWWTYWEKKRTLRGHKTAELIDLANEKHVTIHAIACQSELSGSVRSHVLKIHGPDIERFFGELAVRTNGSFLNLADTGTIDTLHNATVGRQIELVQLKDVTDSDVEAFRSESIVRLAVLPLFPLNAMTFSDYELDASAPALDIETDLIHRLQLIEGRNIIPRRQLQNEWSRFADGANLAPTDLHELARRLNVDFLIWGDCHSVSDSKTVQVTLKAYSRDGTTIISARSVKGESNEVAGQALRSLTDSMRKASQSGNRKVRGFVRLYGSADASAGVHFKFASTEEVHHELMLAVRQLEKATAVDAGTGGSRTDLTDAKKHLETVLKTEPDNLFALVFLASCEYNLHNSVKGDDYLRRAFDDARHRQENDPLRLEIEADYTLFVQKDPLKAIELYEEFVAATQGRQIETAPRKPQAVLRALWMLAGLYLGDWGAAEKWQVDDRQKNPESKKQLEKERLDLARERIIEIIADWPETPEAEYYFKCFSPPLQPEKREAPGNAEIQLANENQPHKVFVPTEAQPKMAGGRIKPSNKDAG